MKCIKQNISSRFFLLFWLAAISAVAQNKTKSETPPNLLIILADQWRGQALGFEGKEPVKTPNVDKFAKESLVLTQMVSNYPVCSPARAMLMTGQYPIKNHVYSNVNSNSAPFGVELQKDAVCWSDILKQNGYFNGYIGKWHLDSPYKPYVPTSNNTEKVAWNEWTSPDRRHGFDYWYAYGTYDEHDKPMYWDTNDKRADFKYVNQWGPIHEADKALSFLKNENDKIRKNGAPFSLVVSMNPPHSEYQTVPEKYYNLYKDIPLKDLVKDPNIPAEGTEQGDQYRKDVRYYYANITGVDEQIGRILQGLKDQKLNENTIVIIMADHGNCLGKHSEVSKNNIYEESLRIPFIVYWKGHILPGIDNTFLGSLPDIYPTLLELMGMKDKTPKDLDGKSYAQYYLEGKGEKPAEQYILGAISSNNVSINTGFRGIRTADYKLAYVRKKGKGEYVLYDLKADPFELKNIYNPDLPIVKKLQPSLIKWLEKTKDGFVLEK
ncbi:sulfatase family protein [Flavobacterium daemonense]|uniref:sulfatase family protein n=1 Tax=Flavobacterium daemonense TaxID=1393049 RepID=UPI001185AB7F|nr:sulfatase [Flavobacterium daemonense]KAF2330650.1 sulfatase [Flavobacterium daemonense]